MSRLFLLSLTVVGTSVKSKQALREVGILSISAVLAIRKHCVHVPHGASRGFPCVSICPWQGQQDFKAASVCPLRKGSLFSAGWFSTLTAPSSFPKTKNYARPVKSEPWGWCPGSKHFESSRCFSCSQGENCPSIVHAELIHSCPSCQWKQDKFSAQPGSFSWVLDFFLPTRHLSWGLQAADQNWISCLLSQTCSFSCPSYFREWH